MNTFENSQLRLQTHIKKNSTDLPQWSHIRRQISWILGKPLILFIREQLPDVRRQHRAKLPAKSLGLVHAVVEVGEEAALVALQGGVADLHCGPQRFVLCGCIAKKKLPYIPIKMLCLNTYCKVKLPIIFYF